MTSGFRQIKSAPASVLRDAAPFYATGPTICCCFFRKEKASLVPACEAAPSVWRENSPHSSEQRSSARAQGALSTISESDGHAHTERILTLHLLEYKALLKAQSYFESTSGLVLVKMTWQWMNSKLNEKLKPWMQSFWYGRPICYGIKNTNFFVVNLRFYSHNFEFASGYSEKITQTHNCENKDRNVK